MMPRDWWPRFHDPAYAPPLREQLALHWQANVLMLRSPKAIVLFCVISGWPVLALVLAWWTMGFLDENNPILSRGTVGIAAALGSFVVFLVLQHMAFVSAMHRTYGPFVRRALCGRGTPVCLACGHLLTPNGGLNGLACPECGVPVR